MAQAIGTLGTIPQINVGGRVFTDLSSSLIVVGASNSTISRWSTLRRAGSTSGYQVTAGKTLTISALQYSTGTAGQQVILAYGTNDLGINNASAPTGAVFLFDNNAGVIQTIANTVVGLPILWPIIAANYAAFQISVGGSCALIGFGYEA